MKEKPVPEEENIPTLTNFLENNQKLISVLGVFTAITVFSLNLAYKPIGYLLSFVFLFLTVVIWIELWVKFPKKSVTSRLAIFENTLSYSILLLIVYWLLAYRDIWWQIMFLPIWLVILSIFVYPIKRLNLFGSGNSKKVYWHQIIRIIFGICLLVLSLIMSWYLSLIISPSVNEALDRMRLQIDSYMK